MNDPLAEALKKAKSAIIDAELMAITAKSIARVLLRIPPEDVPKMLRYLESTPVEQLSITLVEMLRGERVKAKRES